MDTNNLIEFCRLMKYNSKSVLNLKDNYEAAEWWKKHSLKLRQRCTSPGCIAYYNQVNQKYTYLYELGKPEYEII